MTAITGAINCTILILYPIIRCIDAAPKTFVDLKQITRTHAYFKRTQITVVRDFLDDALVTLLAKLHFAVFENSLFNLCDFFEEC